MTRLRFLVPAVIVVVSACGGGDKNQPPPQPTGGYYGTQPPPPGYGNPPPPGYGNQPPPGYQPPPPGYPPPGGGGYPPPGPAPGPAPAPPPGPAPAPPPSGGSTGGTATPLDPNAAGAAALALTAIANTEAPGMAKEGAPMAGNFAAGQTLEQPITIAPGKCYTFIAAGVGPQALQIQLLAQTIVPGLAPVMGDTKGSGQKTVLGGGGKCIKLAITPFPVQAKWVITSTSGGGIVAGQAFSK